MADRNVERLRAERTVTTYQGVMVKASGALAVNVNGNILSAKWADPLVVAEGDTVLVEINSGRSGGGSAFVKARLTDKPRPGEGTVKTVPPSSPTITVTGSDGIDYVAKFVASYVPTVGDPVLLSWNASVPSVSGKITTTAAPPPPSQPVAPPPTAPTHGQTPFPASDSSTFWPPGGWGSWAGGGSHVYQGDFGSGQVFGAYFYSGALTQLAGKTITNLRILLGSRRPVGSNNSPVVVHFYAHTSTHRPGGDVTRVVGPHDVTAWPGQGITEYPLNLSFAPTLQAGGGIGIAFDPYAGFLGIGSEPESGLIIADWSS